MKHYEPGVGFVDGPTETAAAHAAEALDIRPGDTLIVRYSTHLTAEQLAPVDTGLSAALPDVRVIVLRADGMARYRPDTTATEE